MGPHTIRYVALGIILFFFCIFSILDGFDLGVGIIQPFFKRKEIADKMLSSISPFWGGNEVWLVIGAGSIFSVFPVIFASLISKFYLPCMAVVCALILRAVSIEFWYHDARNERLWRTIIALASFIAPCGGMWAIATLILNLSSIITVSAQAPVNLVSPAPLIVAFAGAALVMWHGLVYAIAKDADDGLRGAAKTMWTIVIILMSIAGVFYYVQSKASLHLALTVTGLLLLYGGLIAARVLLHKKQAPFYLSCVSIVGLWTIIAGTIVPHTDLLFKVASPLLPLRIFITVAAAMTPIILIYTFFVYRIFRK